MSISHPARCLLRTSLSTVGPAKRTAQVSRSSACRAFQTTAIYQVRKHRPHYPSLNQEEVKQLSQVAEDRFRKYTDEEWETMKQHYTPQQIEAIRASEEAIDPRDFVTQGQYRTDPWRIKYLDDFRKIDSFADIQPQVEPTQGILYTDMDEVEWSWDTAEKLLAGGDSRSIEDMLSQVAKSAASAKVKDFAETLRMYSMTDQDDDARVVLRKLTERLGLGDPRQVPSAAAAKKTEGMSVQDQVDRMETDEELAANFQSWMDNVGLGVQDDISLVRTSDRAAFETALNDHRFSSETPAIPRFNDPRYRFDSEGDDESAADMKRLSQIMGWPVSRLRKLQVKRLVVHRVVNQTRMGKIDSMYTLFVAGNGDGLLGIGEGKSAEIEDAFRQGLVTAIRNMKPINRYESRTIYGEVEGKSGATEVQLSSRPPGFGVRCQHLIFEMCRVAGIHDLAARVTRARNPMNTIKATYDALTKQRLPEDIARARGRKLVDVRKVYYAGGV